MQICCDCRADVGPDHTPDLRGRCRSCWAKRKGGHLYQMAAASLQVGDVLAGDGPPEGRTILQLFTRGDRTGSVILVTTRNGRELKLPVDGMVSVMGIAPAAAGDRDRDCPACGASSVEQHQEVDIGVGAMEFEHEWLCPQHGRWAFDHRSGPRGAWIFEDPDQPDIPVPPRSPPPRLDRRAVQAVRRLLGLG